MFFFFATFFIFKKKNANKFVTATSPMDENEIPRTKDEEIWVSTRKGFTRSKQGLGGELYKLIAHEKC